MKFGFANFGHKLLDILERDEKILVSYPWERQFSVITNIANLIIIQNHSYRGVIIIIMNLFMVFSMYQVYSQHFLYINAQIPHNNQISRTSMSPLYR